MKLGHARYCISPKEEKFYLIGYKSTYRNNPAKGVHDDIYCQSLLLDIADKKLFIVSLDFLELEDDMVEEVKSILNRKFNINRDLIILSVTHNHSSIMSYHRHWHSGEFDQEYYNFVINTIIKSYQTCLSSMQQVTIKYGNEIVEGFYSNRNHKGELADNEIGVYQFYDENNECVAGIINWAVHSTVLDAKNTMLTGELAGNVSNKLKKYWGFYPLMIVGAAADCSNRYERQGSDFEELDRVSTALAKKISTIKINKTLKTDSIMYQTLSHTISTDIEKYHIKIKEYLLRDDIDKNPGILKKLEEQLKIEEYKKTLLFNVFQLGELQIITFPGELGSKFGLELKQHCRSVNCLGLIAGYTNGFHYYFMPKEEYWLSFETIGNPVPAGEPEKIIEKIKQSSLLLSNQYMSELK
jgi:Neutral/alkaline non-lysosomal ceramidase.